MKYLVDCGADIEKHGIYNNTSALQAAAENGHLDVVEYLYERGAVIDSNGNYALLLALQNGRFPVVEFLRSKGADIHTVCNTVLVLVAGTKRLDIIKYLCENGADVNTDNGMALYQAVRQSHIDVVKYLIENGARINDEFFTVDSDGYYSVICKYGETYKVEPEIQCEFEKHYNRITKTKSSRKV